jgi:hypothetical protein
MIIGFVAGPTDASAAVAAEPPAGTSVDADELLDEVEVRGTRLWELRAAVIEAENRLFARYNDLNRDDDFDVSCHTDAPTGTRFLRRYCWTRLREREEQNDAAAYVDWATGTIIDPKTYEVRHRDDHLPTVQAQVRVQERAEDYAKNLIKLLQDHPELRKLAKQYGEARRRYEAAIQARRKSKSKLAR